MCYNRLRKLRRSRGISQREVARASEVSQSTISRIENGDKILRMEDISVARKIARRLKVRVSVVFPYLPDSRDGDE